MSTISDLKQAYWEDATSKAGTAADLEMAFLESATSKTGTLDDLRSIYFGADGPLPFFQRLTGGEGTLADLEYQFYSNFDPDTAELLNTPGLESIWLSSNVNGVGASLPDDGDAIGLWKDLSSKKRDLSQATMANQPLWRKAGVNLLTTNQATGTDALGNITDFGYSGNALASSTTTWAASGSRSLQVSVNAAGSVDTFAYPGGDIGGMRLGMVAGSTYTFSATVHLETALSNYNLNDGACIDFFYRDALGAFVRTKSNTLPAGNVAGSTGRLSVTVTIPADATEAFVRLYNGSDVIGDTVYFDNLQLELGSTATSWLPPGNAQGLQFDGVNDVLQTVALAGWPETTVYAVASVLGGAGTFRALFNHRYNVNPAVRGLILYTEDSNNFAAWGGNGTSFTTAGYPDGTADSVRHVWSARFNPSSINFRIDGGTSVLAGAGFTPVTAVDNRSIYIGAGNDLGNQFFMPGLIHDIIICSQAHDDATRQKVEAILMKRNGITP